VDTVSHSYAKRCINLFFGYYRDYLDYETCYKLCYKLAEFLESAKKLPIDEWQNQIHSANFFRDCGELEIAEKLYLSIIEKVKNNKSLKKTLDFATLNYAYLLVLLTPPKWYEAIGKLNWLLKQNKEHSFIYLYLAKAYQAKAKSYSQSSSKQIYQQAIFHYEEAIQYDKRKNGYFWYKFGCFYRESINDIPQAINCFNNSLEQNINLSAAIELAEIELQRGNKQKAQTTLQPALELPLKTRLEREQREHLTPRINAILAESNSELT
jgi:predicted Zn-dependent protease